MEEKRLFTIKWILAFAPLTCNLKTKINGKTKNWQSYFQAWAVRLRAIQQIVQQSKSRKIFTAEQIKTAQGKVRSGADFKSYTRLLADTQNTTH